MIYCVVLFFVLGSNFPKSRNGFSLWFLYTGVYIHCLRNPRTQSVIFCQLLFIWSCDLYFLDSYHGDKFVAFDVLIQSSPAWARFPRTSSPFSAAPSAACSFPAPHPQPLWLWLEPLKLFFFFLIISTFHIGFHGGMLFMHRKKKRIVHRPYETPSKLTRKKKAEMSPSSAERRAARCDIRRRSASRRRRCRHPLTEECLFTTPPLSVTILSVVTLISSVCLEYQVLNTFSYHLIHGYSEKKSANSIAHRYSCANCNFQT